MRLNCLSKQQVRDLIIALKGVFDYIDSLRVSNAVASRIQFPKIPPSLSESIVTHLIADKTLLADQDIVSINSRSRQADIFLRTVDGQSLKVEVKATGKSAFQNFGKKDITADYLVWLHFDSFFHDSSSAPCTIFVLEGPGNYFDSPCKLTLQDFLSVVGGNYKKVSVDLNSF